MTTRQRTSCLKQSQAHFKEEAGAGPEVAATAVGFPILVAKERARFWLNLGRRLVPLALLAVDYGAVVLALASAYQFRLRILPLVVGELPVFIFSRSYEFFILPFIYLTLIFYERLYEKRLPFWQSAQRLFKASLAATVIAVGIIYFTYTAHSISRTFVAASGALTFFYLATLRYLTKGLLIKSGLWQKPVIVVGRGRAVGLLAQAFAAEPNMGYRIVGVVGEAPADASPPVHPLLGNLAMAEDVIKASGVRDVIIAMPELGKDKLMELIYRLRPLVSQLSIMPDLAGIPVSNLEVETLFDQRTILLKFKNNLAIPGNRLLKKILDVIIGFGLAIIVVPFILLLIVLIRLDSPGPALFVAKRLGRKGREFDCYKFRTMYQDGDRMLAAYFDQNPAAREEWERYAKLRNGDPRVTRLGRWLRTTSLDELPQVLNVLKGEMSLIGPRPYLPRERERMGYQADTILEAVPGITGLWQVSGRNEITFEGRLELDAWYVRNWSVWLDITLIMKTVGVVLGRKGAY